MAKDARKESLSDGIGFATLKNTFPEASAELVENVRATLRHAQEITASVGEAEAAIERAQSTVAAVDASQTAAERKIVSDEIDKVTRWLNRPPKEETWLEKYLSRNERPGGVSERTASAGNDRSSAQASATGSQSQTVSATATSAGDISKPAPAAAPAGDDASSVAASQSAGQTPAGTTGGGDNASGDAAAASSPTNGAGAHSAHSAAGGALAAAGAAGKISDVSADMAEQIETTVMWVQQLLESVHFAGSEQGLEPGASLLSIVQPGRRIQKDIALTQSVNLFHEKKEEEEDAEDDAPAFRNQALQAVQALSAGMSTPR